MKNIEKNPCCEICEELFGKWERAYLSNEIVKYETDIIRHKMSGKCKKEQSYRLAYAS